MRLQPPEAIWVTNKGPNEALCASVTGLEGVPTHSTDRQGAHAYYIHTCSKRTEVHTGDLNADAHLNQ